MSTSIQRHLAKLESIADGYRAAQVLFTATRLNLFDALRRRPLTAEQLCRTLGTDLRATRILGDALVSLGLLEKVARTYRNTGLAMALLVEGAENDQRALCWHQAELYERWGQLFEVVRTGRPAARTRPRDERGFARAMASAAGLSARETAARLNLKSVRTMLDVGGGPGLYAIECARKNPRLRVTVFDTPKTLKVARQNVVRAGLKQRIACKAGDALKDEWGRDYDLILLSNVVHQYSSAVNERLVAHAARALAPGGRLCIKDFLLQPSRTGPRWASLFAINMLVHTEGGDCFTLSEMRQWLEQAGLNYVRTVPLSSPSKIVVGRKPGNGSFRTPGRCFPVTI